MASNINYTSINENFPIAGQDNDTQVFRDNFDTIKTSLRNASTEITDLQDNVVRVDETNDLNGNLILSATLQDISSRKKDYGSAIFSGTQDISFYQALYHIVRFRANCSLTFSEFPTDILDASGLGKIGKATLELYGDGTTRTISFTPSGVTTFKKSSNFPGVLTVTSAENPVIIEVWQHSSNAIFMNYLGIFA